MSDNAMTRRSFLAGAAGVSALAGCAGFASFNAWQEAYAKPADPLPAQQVHTLCDGCGNHCGVVAWTREERLWRFMGEEGHPKVRGRLCGRGQGYPAIAYSEDRLTQPLKKNDKGTFDAISWDQAYSEIAEKVKATDADKFAIFQAGGAVSPFVKRFAYALGSANYYTDAAVHDADISGVIEAIAGAYPSPDVENATFVLMLDKSTFDGFRPADAGTYAKLHDENKAEIWLVDPRLTAFGRVANEWIQIRPGTELAFLMGIAGEIVRNDLWNEDFVNRYGNGFEAFRKAMFDTPRRWASEKSGVSEDDIAKAAAKLVNNAPHSYIDLPWGGTFGSGYRNSADTVRMVYLINAMLGNFNQAGGWIFGNTPYVSDAMLEAQGIKSVSAPKTKPVGSTDHAQLTGSSCMAAMNAMGRGEIKTAFFCETNPVRDYPAASTVNEALDSLDCMVVCDTMMTETAEKADYVLPLVSYLERGDVIETVAAKTSIATLRNPVVDRIHPETKSLDEIFGELAEPCGIGDAFGFSLEDYNRAYAKAAKLSYEGLAEQGMQAIVGSDVVFGSMPKFRTASGKIDFSSEAMEKAGLSAVPQWTDPQEDTNEFKTRLLVGEQVHQNRTYTIGSDMLTEVSKMYNLDRVWINKGVAEKKGIHDGDKVKVASSEGSLTVQAKVTNCIHPEAVWLPSHYGCTAKKIHEAEGFGVAPKQLIPFNLEPSTGAAMMNETIVTVEKAGA